MSIGDGAFANCPNIREFIVEENNKHYYSFEGGIYSKDNHTLVQYPIGQEDDSFVIPSLVEKIGSNAFAFSKLKRIDFLSNIHFIGSNAFCHCDELKEIHFVNIDPENITIEINAFDFNVKECSLYVSVGKGYAYRHHPVFSRFKEVIIERYQFQEKEQ